MLALKTDSYVVEKNIHFPTDMNLLWDSFRKCLCLLLTLLKLGILLKGWRKHLNWFKKLRKLYKTASEIHRRKGNDYKNRLFRAVKLYVDSGKVFSEKLKISIVELQGMDEPPKKVLKLLSDLLYYERMLNKHIDLLERRILKGEKIPHQEKVFSIFEPDTEWLNKGKSSGVELGHNVLVTTDQYGLVLDYKVMLGETDAEQPIALADRLVKHFDGVYELKSISFDRGFYSLLSKKYLQKKFDLVIMPKKGRKSAADKAEESTADFIAFRKKHSAVESNINELEHSGLNKVPDKGTPAFKRYVGLGVLAHNLKRLGKMLNEQQRLMQRERKQLALAA